LTKDTPEQNHDVTFINLPEWPDYESLSELLDEDFEDPRWSEGYRVDIAQRLLSPEEKWLHYFAPTDTEDITGVSEFGEIATIKRGIATGITRFSASPRMILRTTSFRSNTSGP